MKEVKIGNLYLCTRKSWTLDEFFEGEVASSISTPSATKTLLGWICSFSIDLDDSEGDPSGLHLVLCGREIEAYYPTHINAEFFWQLGDKPRLVTW